MKGDNLLMEFFRRIGSHKKDSEWGAPHPPTLTVSLFASGGGGKLQSYFGYRDESWKNGEPVSAGPHEAVDVTSTDKRLVAPDGGSLSLQYSKGGGLATQFTDTTSLNRLVEMHQSIATLTQFVSDFGMIGTTLNAGTLSGIQHNMLIGEMGNTGKETSGPHTHVEYSQWDADRNRFVVQDPLLYFGANYFSSIAAGVQMISGWDRQLTTSNAISAWEYSQLPVDTIGERYVLDFAKFRNNAANQQRFADVDWGKVDRHIYLEMQKRQGR